MSRRQTLAPLSPSQLNAKGGNSSAPGRTSAKDGATLLSKGRKSIAPGLPLTSVLGPDRRSSVVGPKPGAPKQDRRPLNSKEFQGKCIEIIIAYLTTHNFNAPINAKALQSPTGKDFSAIVTFLFHQIDPAFRITGKVEDEVPILFKRLNYPFQISKSALFAVGSPHSWPAVLAALTWLVEVLEYAEKANTGKGSDPNNKVEAFWEYVATGYVSFLSCDDDRCQQLDEEFAETYIAQGAEADKRCAELQRLNEELDAELAQLQAERDPVEVAEEQLREQLMDNEKLEQLVQQDQGLKQSAMRKLAEKKADVQAKQDQIAAAVADVEQLRQRVAGQKVNKADLNRMLLDRNKHSEVLAAEQAKCADMEKKKHEMDVQVLKTTTAIESLVGRYSQLANRLKLVPATSKRADGTNYELRINRNAASQAEFSNLDLKGVVKPNLERLVEQYRTRANQLSQDLVSLREACAARKESCAEKQDENAALQAEITKLEVKLQEAKDAQEDKYRRLVAQAESIKAQVDELYSVSTNRTEHLQEELSRAQLAYEQTKRETEAELSKLEADVKQGVKMLIAHKEFISSTISRTSAVVRQAKEEVTSMHKTRLFADMATS